MAGENKTLKIRLIGDGRSAVVSIGEVEAASNRLAAGLAGTSRRLRGLGRSLTSTGRTMTHRITMPVLALAAGSVYMATKFNASMTRVQTQAGASAEDVRVLSKAVLSLSGKTQQSPLDLANAMYHLKSVGLDNVKAMDALKEATDFAAVGGADLEDTTNALAGAWRTGIKGAGNFHQAVGTLNAVVGAGNMRMGDLNAALGTGFLASAKTFGLGLKDVGSALALMTDESIPAARAGTRLRMAFSLLGAPTAAAEKQLAKIGIAGKDLGKKLRSGGIVGAIGMLKKHLEGLSKVDQSQLLSRAFGGGRSAAGILTLINNFDVLKKKEKQVAAKAGGFGDAVAKQVKTPEAQFHLLLSTLEMIAVKIGNQLMPVVLKLANGFNHLLEWIDKLPGPVKKALGIFVGLVAVVGPLLMIIGGIASGIAALLTPVGAAVAIVALLAAGIAFAYAHSQKFRDGIDSIGKAMGPLVKFIGGFLKSFLPTLKELGRQFGDAVGPALKQIGDLIRTDLIPAFEKITPILKPILVFLLKIFGGAVIGVISGFIQVIKGVVQVVSGVFSLVSDLIHGRWKAIWHDLLNIVKGVFNILIGAFKVWWNIGIIGIFKHGLVKVLGVFKGGWKKVLGYGKSAIGFLKRLFLKIIEIVTAPWRMALRLALDIVRSGLDKVMRPIKGLGRRIAGVFKGAVGWLWNAGKSIIQGLIDGIKYMAGHVKDAVMGVLKKARNLLPFSPAKEGPFSGKGWTLYSGQAIAQSLADGIGSRVSKVRDAAHGLAAAAHPGVSGGSLAGLGASSGTTYPGGYLRRSNGGVNVYVTVEGNVIGEKDFAKRVTPTIRTELVKTGKRNGGRIFD